MCKNPVDRANPYDDVSRQQIHMIWTSDDDGYLLSPEVNELGP
jgi:hypothetical protein